MRAFSYAMQYCNALSLLPIKPCCGAERIVTGMLIAGVAGALGWSERSWADASEAQAH